MSALTPTHSFALTDEQEQLRKEISDFAAREIAPNVLRWDEASEFPHDIVKKLGPMGVMGMIFPRVRRRGPGLCGLCVGDRGALRRRWVDWDYGRLPQFALHQSHFSRRRREKSANMFRVWPRGSG